MQLHLLNHLFFRGDIKELVAESIHLHSPRAHQPLISPNCAALPEMLVESELFGHVKGAFSGAVSDRSGKFELANGGTLFLDEVDELALAVQSKLLRVLQSGQLQRVGSDREHRVDVRIIAATNRDLAEEVRSGRFRADLYHRLTSECLARHNGRWTQVARELALDRDNLNRLAKRLGIR
ncbi:Sigma-54 dependent transcriptional regulator [Pseudomonas cannabina]|uniref:Sigma-54 dependent transcriptional regulator n=1 Tax=Pseudomonas cannabina TaxID=86840 RepID=A0A0P9L249_PSECA|nr:Sigma-54 dependent transcriptional regulator [Pseudomonas cannabina]RMN32943.1 Sigma-54 dependent transcriptional regulator [Pseudomonas cannabina]